MKFPIFFHWIYDFFSNNQITKCMGFFSPCPIDETICFCEWLMKFAIFLRSINKIHDFAPLILFAKLVILSIVQLTRLADFLLFYWQNLWFIFLQPIDEICRFFIIIYQWCNQWQHSRSVFEKHVSQLFSDSYFFFSFCASIHSKIPIL